MKTNVKTQRKKKNIITLVEQLKAPKILVSRDLKEAYFQEQVRKHGLKERKG